MEEAHLPTVTLSIPTPSGNKSIQLLQGTTVFVVGQNGTGKSALVHRFVSNLGGQAIYLPGSRPSYFDAESLSITPNSRRVLTDNFRQWDSTPDTRWKSISGTSRNERAIHDLTAAETQYKIDAANEIKRDGKESKAITRLQSVESPLDRVNALLQQGNLPITLAMVGAELKAQRNNSQTYSIAKMSDGERTALIMIAEVVAAPSGSTFIIDEPELHLHRSIVVPLISSTIRENPSSSFIVSTHELELLTSCPQASVVLVRGCNWSGETIATWDVDIISSAGDLPEDLRVDILGSRRKVLFVEGTVNSLDSPMYALLFPNVSVRPKGNFREVERAVAGLRAVEDAHHAKAFGMIDGDGMSAEQINAYEAKGIYPLPVHTVESLYYCEEALAAIARHQGNTFGEDPSVLLLQAKAKALEALDHDDRIPYLASRIAERRLRDDLLQHLPERTALITNQSTSITVSLVSPYPSEFKRLNDLRSDDDLASIIARYPVRESGVLDALAKALKFSSRPDYEKAALSRLSAEEPLRTALRVKLGHLATQLA